MKSRTLTILNVINWAAIIGGVLLFIAGYFEGGGGAASGLATAIALTSIIWAPILFVIAIVAFVLEIKFMKAQERQWAHMLKVPSTYVLAFMLFVLVVMFSG